MSFKPRPGADPDEIRVVLREFDRVHGGDIDHQHAVTGAHAFVLVTAGSNAHLRRLQQRLCASRTTLMTSFWSQQ